MAISPIFKVFSPFTSPLGKSKNSEGLSFSDCLTNAVTMMPKKLHQAETSALDAIAGQGDLVDIATSLEEAGLLVKVVTEFHKKAHQVYKDISQMGV